MGPMHATLTQQPVGQGGLMSGLLEIPGGRFHWVYDCGSNQTDALKREIAVAAARGPVDFLFLSHLDSDHVNGIDRLLSATRVKEVVLPYLNDLDRLVAAAHDSATGSLSGTFLTFLGGIEAWFGERGVDRITFIEPRSDDDEGGEGPDLPEDGRGDGEGEIKAQWSPSRKAVPAIKGTKETIKAGPSILRLETSACLRLGAGAGFLNWILVPYAHRPSDRMLLAFRQAMFRKFGSKYISRLHKIIGDKELLDKIRDCYDLIWSDHNLVSMALYAGPIRPGHWRGHCKRHPRQYWHYPYDQNAVGWLGTGDMHLNVGRRRKAFLTHYRHLLGQVNVFGLPHHGSHRNFDSSLPSEIPNATHFVAAAGPNSYGHPDKGVIQMVQANGQDFVRISEKVRSSLEWRHHT